MKSGTKTRAGKSGRLQAEDARSGKSRARRNSPNGPVAREKADLDRTLHFVYGYRGLADEAGNAGGKIRALAWEQVRAFPPIRIRSAQDLLQVSDHTIDLWCQRGILKLSGKSPKRVSLESVLVAQEALEEIRAARRDRDFTSALLNKLGLDELDSNERFRTSLAQAKRGERGEWPGDSEPGGEHPGW